MDSATTVSPAASPATQAGAVTALAKADRYIWGVYIFLLIISLVELYSASSREVVSTGLFGVFTPLVRHAGTLLLGLCAVVAISRMHYSRLIKVIPWFALISALLMVWVLFFGEDQNGARRAIKLGLTIQPSEMIKLAAPLVIALVLARTQNKRSRDLQTPGVWVCMIVVAIYCVLLVTQGMTNTLLLGAISISMLVIGGAPYHTIIKSSLTIIAVAAILCAGVMFFLPKDTSKSKRVEAMRTEIAEYKKAGLVSPFQEQILEQFGDKARVGTWVMRWVRHEVAKKTPIMEQEINDDNAQEIYSYIAQAHGGLFGCGPGNSRETSRLPLAFSDYIYSIIIEEIGIAGAFLVLMAYLFLLGRAFVITKSCSRALPALLILGMSVTVVWQALFHMAIVVGRFPVSGQPLPLISKGGCSILMVSIAFGIMLSVSRYAARVTDKKSEQKREQQALPEDLAGENPTIA